MLQLLLTRLPCSRFDPLVQHPGESCRQFERKTRASEKLAAAHIAQFARPCPGCKQPIEKSGGCNHMTCPNPACGTNFCWLCGRTIGGGTMPNHYAPWNLAGCPNMQMGETIRAEGVSNRAQEFRMCIYRILYVPAAIIIISLVLSIVLSVLSLALGWFFAFGAIAVIFVPCLTLGKRATNGGEKWDSLIGVVAFCPVLPCAMTQGCCDSD